MSQYPPASQHPSGGDFDETFVATRTSIMAVAALVLSLLCPIPGLGLIAVILGIASLVAINSARGRLGGTGMAVAGIILGVLVSACQVAAGIALVQVVKVFEKIGIAPVAGVAEAIEKGDTKGARALLVASANDAITDEQILAFRDAYRAKVGSYKGMPKGIVEMITAYQSVGPSMQSFANTHNLVPFVAEFDQSLAFFVVEVPDNFDTHKPGQSIPNGIPAKNLAVFTLDGQKIWLVDPNAQPAPATKPGEPPKPGGGG